LPLNDDRSLRHRGPRGRPLWTNPGVWTTPSPLWVALAGMPKPRRSLRRQDRRGSGSRTDDIRVARNPAGSNQAAGDELLPEDDEPPDDDVEEDAVDEVDDVEEESPEEAVAAAGLAAPTVLLDDERLSVR
jgi:hypothetical protein